MAKQNSPFGWGVLGCRGTAEERFWKNIVKGEKEEDCWGWKGCKHHTKYGIIRVERKNVIASRFSYELHNGRIPDEMFVCHSCDNPPCCNPKHLWIGSPEENNKDRDQKGRQKTGNHKGESNGRAKLSQKQVNEIRKMWKNEKHYGLSIILQKKYKVKKTTIYTITSNKSWAPSLTINK